jgi:hypothetical protein
MCRFRGYSNNTWHVRWEGGAGLAKMSHDNFLLVISLVKVDKKCHMGGLKSAEKVSHIFWMAFYGITENVIGEIL